MLCYYSRHLYHFNQSKKIEAMQWLIERVILSASMLKQMALYLVRIRTRIRNKILIEGMWHVPCYCQSSNVLGIGLAHCSHSRNSTINMIASDCMTNSHYWKCSQYYLNCSFSSHSERKIIPLMVDNEINVLTLAIIL